MRVGIVALLGGAAVVTMGLSALPAAAGSKDRAAETVKSSEVSSQRRRARRSQRARTRITVRRRTYLDAGTTTLPGERKYSDYAFPLGYRATNVLSGAGSHAGSQNPWFPSIGPYHPWP